MRYATCGLDDVRHAQPFERQHGRLWKWFCFAFNGNLANFAELRDRLLAKELYHFVLNTDTEIIMHSIAYGLRGDTPVELRDLVGELAGKFDGAYNIVFLDAMGRMFVVRDPLGLRPMSWAVEDGLFGAASESVALTNAGFHQVRPLEPGEMIIVEDGRLRVERYAPAGGKAHCFFEWVYFSNVASIIDGAGVYMTRANSGRRLAEQETETIDETCIVVPVPDTAKAAADAFAYHLGIPSVEGLIRNRYVGRTFIEPATTRDASAGRKYTPLPSVLAGKRVFLVEDSIVRATTLRALAARLRERRQGAGGTRPRGLPAHRGAVLLRHRHVHAAGALRAAARRGGLRRPPRRRYAGHDGRGAQRGQPALPGRAGPGALHRRGGGHALPGLRDGPLPDGVRQRADGRGPPQPRRGPHRQDLRTGGLPRPQRGGAVGGRQANHYDTTSTTDGQDLIYVVLVVS